MTWIERTASLQFKRLTSARVQKMARFPSPDEIPDVVIDHVRRCLELAEDIWPASG
jgi:hypothetical protein